MIKEEEATLHILTTRGRRVYHLQFCSQAEKVQTSKRGWNANFTNQKWWPEQRYGSVVCKESLIWNPFPPNRRTPVFACGRTVGSLHCPAPKKVQKKLGKVSTNKYSIHA